MLRQNSIQKIIQNNFCMVNSIQNSIQNFEISRIQFNKIFIQFENVGIDHGYCSVIQFSEKFNNSILGMGSKIWGRSWQGAQTLFTLSFTTKFYHFLSFTRSNIQLTKQYFVLGNGRRHCTSNWAAVPWDILRWSLLRS